LTDTQLGLLCDWENAQLGGYGVTLVCPVSGPPGPTEVHSAIDQADCIEHELRPLQRCDITVEWFEGCLFPLADQCDSFSLCYDTASCRPPD
jgi:hypothetical protein